MEDALRALRGTLGGRATRKKLRMREGTVATFCCEPMFFKRCLSLQSIHPMRNPERFRHLTPYPHKSAVMAQVF